MNKDVLIEAISNIPDGKKRDHLGSSFVEALVNYSKAFGESTFTLDELVLHRLESLIQKNSFLSDIVNFNENLEGKIKRHDDSSPLSKKALKVIFSKAFGFDLKTEKKFIPTLERASSCETKLHDFQERIRRRVMHLFFAGQKKFLIHMPTGSGKTRTAAEIILDFIRVSPAKALFKNNIQILWVAQSSELCQQAFETVKFIMNKKGVSDVNFNHFYDTHSFEENDNSKPTIHFVGIQKLLLHYQSEEWSKVRENTFLVVIDEAHRSIAQRWIHALEYFTRDDSVYTIGLTATPGIGALENGVYSLANFYQGNKITITDENFQDETNPIQFLVRKGYLARIERFTIQNDVSNEKISLTNGEFKFSGQTLKSLSRSAKRNHSIINIINNNKELKVLVFTCGKEHNSILSNLLMRQGINSGVIDESTKNREAIIQDFKHGSLNILLNFGVLTTGFDAPKTNVCVIADGGTNTSWSGKQRK